MPNRTNTRVKYEDEGVNFGLDEGSFSASISSSGVLSLGIGIAEVELNLKDPNESTISYIFGLYEIEGERQGCSVILHYKIAGQETHTETRTIPECDPGPAPTPEPTPEPDPGLDPKNFPPPKDPKRPTGNPYDRVMWIINRKTRSLYSTATEGGFIWEQNHIYTFAHSPVLITNNRFTVTVERRGFSKRTLWENGDFVTRDVENLPLISPNVRRDAESALYMNSDHYRNAWGVSFYPFCYGISGLRYEVEKHFNWAIQRSKLSYRNLDYPNVTIGYTDGSGPRLNVPVYNKLKEELEVIKEILIEPSNFPPIHSQPPPIKKIDMDKRCCEMIEEIYQALDTHELLTKGFEVPKKWVAANTSGYEKLNNYLEIAQWQMRQADHLGIHPFTAIVTDYNAAQEGDQELKIQAVNATAFAKIITELLLENKGDSATRLNLMVRTAIAVGQILNVVSIGTKRTREIMRFLGVPVKEKEFKVKMPFDFSFGERRKTTGKGFGGGANQKAINKLDINTEEATEKLLPLFMQDEEQPIVVEMFDDNQPRLPDLIRQMLGRK